MHDRLLRPAMVGVSKKPKKVSESDLDKESIQDNKYSEKDMENQEK